MPKAGFYFISFFLCWLQLFWPVDILFAQEYSLKNYAVDDGVPSPEVYCSMQDSKGYMWFGTDRGVCKFNGYKFETFTTADGLCYNTVFQIHEDYKKRIWFISNSNQLCFYEGNQVKQHSANKQLQKLFPNTILRSFYLDTGDTIWLAVNDYGLIKITPGNIINTVHKNEKQYIKIFDNKHFIYSQSNEPALTIEQGNPIKNIEIKLTGQTFPDPHITRSSQNEFLLVHGPRNNILTTIKNNKVENTHNFNYPIICALKPDKNELWLGLRSQGLFWFSNNNYTTPTNRLLKNTTVTSISKDKEGNFWLTTLEDGIYLLRTLNVISYRALDEEDNNKYLATFSDRENLWIGTDKGFTYKVNQKNAFFRYSSLESAVTSIIQTDRKEIWLGSNSGLHKVNGNHLTLIPSETNLARIFNGQDGKIWASRNKSLHIFKDDKWQKCEGKNEGENGYIDALIEDKNGIAWLACNDGLWQYDISKAIYTKIKSVNVRINDLKIAKNQSIWMASQGEGIFLIENGRQKKFKKENGLLSNLCNNVYIDDNETVWVSTYKGLNFIKRAQNGNFTIGAITTKDGLISNEVLECCKFQNKLWVFTGNGISVFDPDKIKPDTFSPPTYITAVNINARSTPLSKSYTLDYQENNIAIEFLALYFKNAGKVRYRYKMLGIDTSWNYTENTSVQYGTLQPGKYTFMVAAQNNSGSWAAVSDNILFNIHPPYWQKTWFRILIFLLFLSLIALLVNFRIRYVVKRKNLIYELEGYKNHALQARMNPHFIFNSLNSINNYILQNDKLNSSKYLSKFASLMRFILDNSVRTDISLETELRGLQLYLELEKQRFKEKLNYTISISPDINVNTTKIPALILQPFVENAILHGILTKNTPGNIQIIIKRENEKISCIIQDDGIGRKKSSERVERKSHDHVSNGIAVTKQRLDIINKLHQEKTVLEISDILNENGEIAGTKVQLSWPIY